jgi:hypothetical protein
MSYRHIENLYKNKDILMFRECFAMEKIHGTSAHVKYNHKKNELTFFSGGAKHDQFVDIFDRQKLLEKFKENAIEHGVNELIVYGEAYGGKMQRMSSTYGKDLKFIVFEVFLKDNNWWFDVEQANRIATVLGFEFVHYKRIATTEESINAEMMSESVQAIRNGMGTGHMREGIVLRPLKEFIFQNGGRVICKHKMPEFAERRNTPRFSDPKQIKILEDAKSIAEEWVTPMRLKHVLDKFHNPKLEDANKIIKAMVEDIESEAEGEILSSKPARKAIGKETMRIFKEMIVKNTFDT